jgi:hypothetical protein
LDPVAGQLLTARIEGRLHPALMTSDWRRFVPSVLLSPIGRPSMFIPRPAPRRGFSGSPSAIAIVL